MKNVTGLGVGLVLAASAYQEVEAATFTPDMWVYEVTLKATELVPDTTSFIAIATTSNFDNVPAGCIADMISMDVACTTIPPGLDPLATVDASFAPFLSRTARIGFNAFSVVCELDLIGGCPGDGMNSTFPPGFGGPPSYSGVQLDAVLGTLSYCAVSVSSVQACYNLSPGAVTASVPFLWVGRVFGFWDFGDGGSWSGSPDSFFSYSGTGQLVAQPQVIPLPAPLLMLGSGLAALGALRARRKVRNGGVERST